MFYPETVPLSLIFQITIFFFKMISKNKVKLIKSLAQKKYRAKNNLFLVEGNKLVTDILKSNLEIKTLIATEEYLSSIKKFTDGIEEVIQTTKSEINKASLLKNPQECIALCKIPNPENLSKSIGHELCLCLEGIQDPGNLGTIMRIADWFGIYTIFASHDTADLYNPKVVQATMGAITRVKIIYCELIEIATKAQKEEVPVYGTFMDGENIYNKNLNQNGLVVMGNEGKGISKTLEKFIDEKILIPGYSEEKQNLPDSLNVSMATAIVCSEFRRDILGTKSRTQT